MVYKSVELGLRGAVGDETMVAVKGIDEGAVILGGAVGTLRDGAAVKFTTPVAAAVPMPVASTQMPPASGKTAP